MTKDEKIIEALKEISVRLQGVEDRQRETLTIVVEQGTDISDIRTHQLDDANRTGTQVHRHENQIIEINARLHKLDGQTPKGPRSIRAGNGSAR